MISIRKFQEEDISLKVKWINDTRNNLYLHYDLPLREDKTTQWFNSIKNRTDRIDCTILYNNAPVGLIGLLNINKEKLDAEYYVCLGEETAKGKGIASKATDLLIKEAYEKLGLKSLYLFTEVENLAAQKLFERNQFEKIKLIRNELFYNGRYVDRYLYQLIVEQYINNVGGL